MAVNSGSFNTTAYSSRCLTFSWSVASQSTATNKTTINWSLKGAGGATNNYFEAGNFKVVIDGTTVYSSATRIQLFNGTTVASGTHTLSHNNTGDKTFSASAEAGIYTIAVNVSGSGSWTLPKIPRYATSNQSVASKTETSIKMNWSSDSTIDYIWYSKNNGSSWTAVGSVNAKSGSYTISGLSANTNYDIKTRVRRKDSQLTTDSSKMTVATYNYPFANSMPNFTIGNKLTIGIYNPLNRSVTVNIIGADNSQISNDTTTGTSISGYNGATVVDNLYKSIPNAKSGTYKVKVTYGSQVSTKTGGTYTVNTNNCSPSITSGSYEDVNNATVSFTENNQLIIRNKSQVKFYATGLTANKYASISSCKVTVNGKNYNLTVSGSSASGGNAVIDSANNVTATLTLTDSRGLTATKNITVNMLDWVLPSAIISLQRQNNYYSETDINVDANYSSLDGKNSVTIQARYKKVGDSTYSSYVTLQDNVTSVLTLDNTFEWDVQVLITDAFGSTTYNVVLQIGMPIVFFDRLNSSTGFNCFPKNDYSVEIKGKLFLNDLEIPEYEIVDTW